eukprot:m.218150 g.218150  ORF g.218150 m.218150 type:complete len:56 (+) comp17215_c0_seq4:3680-3847(+)
MYLGAKVGKPAAGIGRVKLMGGSSKDMTTSQTSVFQTALLAVVKMGKTASTEECK